MDPQREARLAITRRHFFGLASTGIGTAALAFADEGLQGLPHFPPKAKRVIFLHQSGGPSQMDLFDYKPSMRKLQGSELPDSIRRGQRITGMTSGQSSFPVARPLFKFSQHAQSRPCFNHLLPPTP